MSKSKSAESQLDQLAAASQQVEEPEVIEEEFPDLEDSDEDYDGGTNGQAVEAPALDPQSRKKRKKAAYLVVGGVAIVAAFIVGPNFIPEQKYERKPQPETAETGTFDSAELPDPTLTSDAPPPAASEAVTEEQKQAVQEATSPVEVANDPTSETAFPLLEIAEPFETLPSIPDDEDSVAFEPEDEGNPLLLSSVEQRLQFENNKLNKSLRQTRMELDKTKDKLANTQSQLASVSDTNAELENTNKHLRTQLSKYQTQVSDFTAIRSDVTNKPEVIVQAVVEPPQGCTSCVPMAIISLNGERHTVQTGDTLKGYTLTVGTNFVRLEDDYSQYSYFPHS